MSYRPLMSYSDNQILCLQNLYSGPSGACSEPQSSSKTRLFEFEPINTFSDFQNKMMRVLALRPVMNCFNSAGSSWLFLSLVLLLLHGHNAEQVANIFWGSKFPSFRINFVAPIFLEQFKRIPKNSAPPLSPPPSINIVFLY